MRFRILNEAGAYLCLDPTPVKLDLGGGDIASRNAYNVTAPVYQVVPMGAEIEGRHIAFGPHMLPLDAEAEAAAEAYFKAKPGASLDPTRSLPLGRDPFAAATYEHQTLAVLERMAADAASRPAPAAASDAKIDAMAEAITTMAAMMAHLIPKPAASQTMAAASRRV